MPFLPRITEFGRTERGSTLNTLRRQFSPLFALLAPLALAGVASASTVTFDSASQYFDNFGVGIYSAMVNGVQKNVFCDDFYTDISNNQSWAATDGTNDPVSGGLLFNGSDVFLPFPIPGNVTTQQDYNMIGFLANKIFADPTNVSGDWGYDSFAIWALNDKAAWTTAQTGGFSPEVLSLLSAAYNNRNTTSDFAFWTPNPTNAGQEFGAPVPEPPSLWLFISALALLGLGYNGAKRKFARQ
ncbi:MAG: hypothetical protein WCF77_05145 [Minisyncoccia bacterium]|jgi:hypothetical protein